MTFQNDLKSLCWLNNQNCVSWESLTSQKSKPVMELTITIQHHQKKCEIALWTDLQARQHAWIPCHHLLQGWSRTARGQQVAAGPCSMSCPGPLTHGSSSECPAQKRWEGKREKETKNSITSWRLKFQKPGKANEAQLCISKQSTMSQKLRYFEFNNSLQI